jgi:threonine 3-dehydrogenase
MKALVKSRAERGLWLDDIPEPAAGINDVLVRAHYTGICGTDVHIYEWDDWAKKTIPVPMVIGHEFVGEIVEVGSNVNDFSVGDIVSGKGMLSVAAAATASRAGATYARPRSASVSTVRARLRS